MADLSITAANVVVVSGSPHLAIAGATITQGQAIYIDATGKAQLAKNDTAIHAAAVGIALASVSAGQWLPYAPAGSQVTIGATVVKGAIYSVSSTAGNIQAEGDFTTGYFVTQIGRAPNVTDIFLDMLAYGYAHG